MVFWKKKEKGEPRALLSGSVIVGGVEWIFREEKRGGEQSQIFILTDPLDGERQMHVRPLPGAPVTDAEQLALAAGDPNVRWVVDTEGLRWEVRSIITTEPGRPPARLAKFIHSMDVHEGEIPAEETLGTISDSDLVGLLNSCRSDVPG